MSELEVKELAFLERGPYSFSIKQREIFCLSGLSGAGKSLLLRALADLEPHDGDMLLNGADSLSFSGSEWRQKVMYLPAESQWWNETVAEHFSDTPQTELLNSFGFAPEILTWEISRLSSGERQRLSILRLLQHKPEVLLLDEPTASLDPTNIARVEALIVDYLTETNSCAVWTSHDPMQIGRVATQHHEVLPGGKLNKVL